MKCPPEPECGLEIIPRLCLKITDCKAEGSFVVENKDRCEKRIRIKIKKLRPIIANALRVKPDYTVTVTVDGATTTTSTHIVIPPCKEATIKVVIELNGRFRAGLSYVGELIACTEFERRRLLIDLTVPEECGCDKKHSPDREIEQKKEKM